MSIAQLRLCRVMLLVYLMTKTVWYKEDMFWNHGALALNVFFVSFFSRHTLEHFLPARAQGTLLFYTLLILYYDIL